MSSIRWINENMRDQNWSDKRKDLKNMTQQEKSKREYYELYAYVDFKKRKVGYAYLTDNGGLCIKGDKLMDKNQLGRLLLKGLYVSPPE